MGDWKNYCFTEYLLMAPPALSTEVQGIFKTTTDMKNLDFIPSISFESLVAAC